MMTLFIAFLVVAETALCCLNAFTAYREWPRPHPLAVFVAAVSLGSAAVLLRVVTFGYAP